MLFYVLTSAWPLGGIKTLAAPREMLKPEPEMRGFQHPQGAKQLLMFQKSMFYRYYCIKTFFFCSKTLEKLLQKVLFTCTCNGAEKHVTYERFENATFRAKTKVIATVHFTDHTNAYS